MRLAFILNPAARNGRAGRGGRVRDKIEKSLASRGVEATIVETATPGHATEIAASLAGSNDAVVAVGGDGTAHEVVRGLFGTTTPLGILPEGTGNDFAHALGMPDDVDEAVGALLSAPVKPIDLGRVRWTERVNGEVVSRDELFVNCIGAGFDGLVATLVPKYKWIGGNAAYLAAVFRALSKWKKPRVEVALSSGEEDGPLYDGPLYFISVCNGYSIGGGFLMTPEAEPDDGRLDLCLVRGMPVLRVLRLLPLTFTGRHVGAPEVMMRRLKRLRAASTAPLPMQADGEVITYGADTIEVEVLPAAMTALTPGRR